MKRSEFLKKLVGIGAAAVLLPKAAQAVVEEINKEQLLVNPEDVYDSYLNDEELQALEDQYNHYEKDVPFLSYKELLEAKIETWDAVAAYRPQQLISGVWEFGITKPVMFVYSDKKEFLHFSTGDFKHGEIDSFDKFLIFASNFKVGTTSTVSEKDKRENIKFAEELNKRYL